MKKIKIGYLVIMLSIALIAFEGCYKDNKVKEGETVNPNDKLASEVIKDESLPLPEVNIKVKEGEEQIADLIADRTAEQLEVQSEEQSEEQDKDQAREDNSWSYRTKRGVVASPIIVGERIFFGSKDGIFYAIDISTGNEVWTYEAGNPIYCQAAVLDDIIFFSCMEVYYGININTGNELWKVNLEADSMYTRRKDEWDYHDPAPVIDQGVVYFGSSTGGIRGFDAATGHIVWDFELDTNIAVRSTPLIKQGVIYYGDWKGSFKAVDIKTKQILWKNEYNSPFQSSIALKEDVLIIGGRDTKIHALNISNGEQLWEYKDPNGSWITGDPTIYEDIVYVPTSDARLVYALNIYDGTIVSTYSIYKNSFTKALIVDDLLYISSGDAYISPGTGKIQVYQLEKPESILWEVDVTTGGVFTTPIVANGMIYYGCLDGCLYANTVK